MEIDEIEAIYEGGVLRIVNPAKIESDVVTVRILNRDEMLREKEYYSSVERAFKEVPADISDYAHGGGEGLYGIRVEGNGR